MADRLFDKFGQIYGSRDDLTTRGGIFDTEDGQTTFTDGQGNKTWFATASAAAATITLPPPADALGQTYTVKRKTATANALNVVSTSGKVENTTTYTVVNQFDAPTFRSDGTNYHVVWEKAAVDTSSLLSSASARSAIATDTLAVSLTASVGSLNVVGNANHQGTTTLSGAVNCLTTLSVSGATDFRSTISISGAMNCLTTLSVSGAANFKTSVNISATASVGALSIAGVAFSQGMTLITTLTTTSGTTQSVTGISASYRELFIEIEGVSFTAAAVLNLALSSNNGVSYGTAIVIAATTGTGAGIIGGSVRVVGIRAIAAGSGIIPATIRDGAAVTYVVSDIGTYNSGNGPCDAIRFAGGTFDAGTIRVYGIQ